MGSFKMRVLTTAVAVFAAAALSGCATTAATSSKPAAGDAAKAGPLPKGLDSGRGEDAYASTYRPRPAYRFTVEDSIYVASDVQGKGVGRILLEALIVECRTRGFRRRTNSAPTPFGP